VAPDMFAGAVGMVAGVFPVVTSSSFMAHNLLVKITVCLIVKQVLSLLSIIPLK